MVSQTNEQALEAALEQGKKIITTTIQRFPFVLDYIGDFSQKSFAVVIDEAHSSQSGVAHDNMNRAMGKKEVPEESEPDVQDKILEEMASRKMRGNASSLPLRQPQKTSPWKNSVLSRMTAVLNPLIFTP